MSNWTSPREALPAYCDNCDRAYNPAAGDCPRCTVTEPAPIDVDYDTLAEFMAAKPSKNQLVGMFIHLHQTGRIDAVLDALPPAGKLAALLILEDALPAAA